MSAVSELSRGAQSRLVRLDRLLCRAYGTPEASLGNHADPLDEAIYIVLSFQTDLARLKRTWGKLRATFPSWEELHRAPAPVVERAIREGGLQRQKAKTIK